MSVVSALLSPESIVTDTSEPITERHQCRVTDTRSTRRRPGATKRDQAAKRLSGARVTGIRPRAGARAGWRRTSLSRTFLCTSVSPALKDTEVTQTPQVIPRHFHARVHQSLACF